MIKLTKQRCEGALPDAALGRKQSLGGDTRTMAAAWILDSGNAHHPAGLLRIVGRIA
jgi:hypothetical protein